MYIKGIILLFVIVIFINISGCSPVTGRRELSIAFYNCENLFDTVHNPNKDDLEFTPTGKYHYTQKVYEQKIHNIAAVLQSMDGDAGPAVIGLAEVENNAVLDDLIRQPELAKRHYKYEWFDGPDPRGINVAMLYNPELFQVIKSEHINVDLAGTEGKTLTRDVLHVYGVLSGDTVHMFVNHWPSRTSGKEESEPKRIIAARVVRNAIMPILKTDPNSKIMVMGDFNDNPTDSSISVVLDAKEDPLNVADTDLFNPWDSLYIAGTGTEEYNHAWNLFDQVIVSKSFLANKDHQWQYGKAEIYKPDFLISHAKGHEGEPHRSFVGPFWINGYSDHFPVLLYLKK